MAMHFLHASFGALYFIHTYFKGNGNPFLAHALTLSERQYFSCIHFQRKLQAFLAH